MCLLLQNFIDECSRFLCQVVLFYSQKAPVCMNTVIIRMKYRQLVKRNGPAVSRCPFIEVYNNTVWPQLYVAIVVVVVLLKKSFEIFTI